MKMADPTREVGTVQGSGRCTLSRGVPEEDVVVEQSGACCIRIVVVYEEEVVGKQYGMVSLLVGGHRSVNRADWYRKMAKHRQ